LLNSLQLDTPRRVGQGAKVLVPLNLANKRGISVLLHSESKRATTGGGSSVASLGGEFDENTFRNQAQFLQTSLCSSD
jgi:hypothetical protein